MDERSAFSVSEIVGIATVGAAALGGVIVALGRAQSSAGRGVSVTAPVGQGADAVAAGVERGKDVARQMAVRIAERAPALREQASDIVLRIDPKRVSGVASAGAEQARSAGSSLLERVQERVVPTVAGALDSAASAASNVAHSAEPAADGVRASVAASAERAVDKSTSLAKETMATLFWLVAASALVYLALLSPERRERLKSFLSDAFDQTRMLIEDFQGYSEEI